MLNTIKKFKLVLCLGAMLALGCVSPDANSGELQESGQSTGTQKNSAALKDPSKANKMAPDTFKVKFVTTQGDFVLEVYREWAPNAADRFYNLVDIGYFEDTVIFRAIENFMFQFGIHKDPSVTRVWQEANLKDDTFKGNSNLPYTISFAQTGRPNSRSCQMFINLGNNSNLDADKDPYGRPSVPFVTFGKVIEGKDVVDKINTEYGENGPMDQSKFVNRGNDYILARYPKLDIIKKVVLLNETAGEEKPAEDKSGEQEPAQQPEG